MFFSQLKKFIPIVFVAYFSMFSCFGMEQLMPQSPLQSHIYGLREFFFAERFPGYDSSKKISAKNFDGAYEKAFDDLPKEIKKPEKAINLFDANAESNFVYKEAVSHFLKNPDIINYLTRPCDVLSFKNIVRGEILIGTGKYEANVKDFAPTIESKYENLICAGLNQHPSSGRIDLFCARSSDPTVKSAYYSSGINKSISRIFDELQLPNYMNILVGIDVYQLAKCSEEMLNALKRLNEAENDDNVLIGINFKEGHATTLYCVFFGEGNGTLPITFFRNSQKNDGDSRNYMKKRWSPDSSELKYFPFIYGTDSLQEDTKGVGNENCVLYALDNCLAYKEISQDSNFFVDARKILFGDEGCQKIRGELKKISREIFNAEKIVYQKFCDKFPEKISLLNDKQSCASRVQEIKNRSDLYNLWDQCVQELRKDNKDFQYYCSGSLYELSDAEKKQKELLTAQGKYLELVAESLWKVQQNYFEKYSYYYRNFYTEKSSWNLERALQSNLMQRWDIGSWFFIELLQETSFLQK